jgi:hypothetical protein
MYPRTIQRRNKDGSVVRRVQHTTRRTDTQRAIYRALKVAPPPPVATVTPPEPKEAT